MIHDIEWYKIIGSIVDFNTGKSVRLAMTNHFGILQLVSVVSLQYTHFKAGEKHPSDPLGNTNIISYVTAFFFFLVKVSKHYIFTYN